MKKILIIIISFTSSLLFSQNNTKEIDTIRSQGYLLIKDYSSKIDIPMEYIFLPLNRLKNSLENSYYFNINYGSNEIFLIHPYFKDINSVAGLNAALAKTKLINYSFINVSIDSKDFFSKANSIIYCKEKIFKVIYIDGIWVRMKISKKYASFFAEPYNLKILNQNNKEYIFNFLIDLKVYSINPYIQDKDSIKSSKFNYEILKD